MWLDWGEAVVTDFKATKQDDEGDNLKMVTTLRNASGRFTLFLAALAAAAGLGLASADVEETGTGRFSWEGVYVFEEFAPPNQSADYRLRVYRDGDTLNAHLTADGFQLLRDINCAAEIFGSKLVLKFASYGEDDIHYVESAPGAVQLTLERRADGTLLTHWGEMTPMLEENEVSGKPHFQKTDDVSPSIECSAGRIFSKERTNLRETGF